MGTLDDWDELGPPELRPVPEGHRTARRAAVATAVILAGIGLVAFGVWMAAGGTGEPKEAPKPSTTTSSVTESFTVSTAPTSAGTPGATGTPGVSGGDTQTPTTTPAGYTRSPRVAYRKDDALWVSAEGGQAARKVVESTSGAFALSPDGLTLAFVDGRAKTLALADVATSRVTTVGPADVEPPAWAPSSTWLAYASNGKVDRVERDGSGRRFLGTGHFVAIGPDDTSFVLAGTEAAVFYAEKGGALKRLATAGGPVDGVALGRDRVYYAVAGSSRASVSLNSMSLSGQDDRKLAGPPKETGAGGYGGLELSPDGSQLAYRAVGDTMFSRLRCMRVDGNGDRAISMRRDGYLLRWSADGKRLLFIDGNVLQGDTTQLMSVRPDGTGRIVVVKDAGI